MNSRVHLIRRWVTDSFGGRALALGAAIKLLAVGGRFLLGATPITEMIGTAANVCLVLGAIALVSRLFTEARHAILWRVHRKLTISYFFIGFIPALLIVAFFAVSDVLLFSNFSSYVLTSRMTSFLDETQLLAQSAAFGLQRVRSEEELEQVLVRRQVAAAVRYPKASYAIVPVDRLCNGAGTAAVLPPPSTVLVTGPWSHGPAPDSVPAWVPCEGRASLVAYPVRALPAGTIEMDGEKAYLVVRGVAFPDTPTSRYAVVVDIPLSTETFDRLRAETGIELGNISASVGMTPTPRAEAVTIRSLSSATPPVSGRPAAVSPTAEASPRWWRRVLGSIWDWPLDWVAFLDVTEWATGRHGTAGVSIRASVGSTYQRIFATPSDRTDGFSFANTLLIGLGLLAGLFFIIQSVALWMGVTLARSITGAIHALFVGTQRVRHGDFAHRIEVRSRDQLGELATSFNSMTASIEGLLLEKEEKERMEQELRIARRIQMSLLPAGPATFAGLSLTAHCEPAREVGGDYYDYFPIDEHRIGLLIADVSGKGTSAALYMAELKGLMLALARRHDSPRELLVDANRIISHHIDTRSFITVTYAIVDVRAQTLTYARAGHCPLIYVPGPFAASRAPRVLTDGGLVLGLQIDNGEMFERLLADITLPLSLGDLFLFYTDGLTEAMNPDGDCFGDERLAALVQQHADVPFEVLRERILREVNAFTGPVARHDDMTMVLVRVEEARR